MMYPLLSERLLTLSSGIFAGFGVTLHLVCVPAIRSSANPLSVLMTTFNRGKKTAFTCMAVSTLASVNCYLNSNDKRFLYVSGLMFAGIFAFTEIVMKPTLDQLYRSSNDDKQVPQLIEKWAQLQYVKTALIVSAFILNLYLI